MTGTFRRLFSDVADFNACIENNVGGIRVVQAFGNEKFEKEQFAVNNARFRTTKLMAYKIMALNSSISYMLMRLVTLFVLICGTWFCSARRINVRWIYRIRSINEYFLPPN